MGVLLMVHSLWRWLVLLAAVGAIAGAVTARSSARVPGWAVRTGLVYTILIDVQVLIGLALWVANQWWMGNAFYAFIHPLTMLLGLGVAHMGRGREKRAAVAGQPGGAGLWAYVGSLVLILLGIPWFQ